ncbi:hypothetical protein HELRODRAFT_174427 [Helobdella robusta]|uniref:Uncharacterized protein n=1 Tax=Helobdella robusta TaxID=6412 RepID=T1F841_HELRO|nr:hypothetical protein HELRODRAFT_174427 [Helobdella robusta]ESO02951.1 hypothetical protein HELRODRAFT_174427 [Helobdella robusta]
MHPFKFIFGTLPKILNGISMHSIWSDKAISMIDSVLCQSRNSGNVRISGPLAKHAVVLWAAKWPHHVEGFLGNVIYAVKNPTLPKWLGPFIPCPFVTRHQTLVNLNNSTGSTNYFWVVSYLICTELAMEVEPAVWFVQRHICSSADFLELYKRINFPQMHVIPDDSNPCCITQSTAFCFEFMSFVNSIDDRLLTAGKFMAKDEFKMSDREIG